MHWTFVSDKKCAVIPHLMHLMTSNRSATIVLLKVSRCVCVIAHGHLFSKGAQAVQAVSLQQQLQQQRQQ